MYQNKYELGFRRVARGALWIVLAVYCPLLYSAQDGHANDTNAAPVGAETRGSDSSAPEFFQTSGPAAHAVRTGWSRLAEPEEPVVSSEGSTAPSRSADSLSAPASLVALLVALIAVAGVARRGGGARH